MTLKLMQGFESMRDDTDFRTQGWVTAPSKVQAALAPSFSAVAGTSMRSLGAGSASAAVPGATGAPDIGYYNTGITINQAYLAGGFSYGFNARFNSGVQSSYASGSTANPNQSCFDGTNYWAIRISGGVYQVAYSTDLINWSVTSSQPPGGLDSSASIAYMGSGLIAVVRVTGSTSSLAVYYTNNLGVSWTTQVLATSGSSTTILGSATATGNATYPHAVMIGTNGVAGSNSGLYVGTLGGTMTLVSALTGLNASSKPHLISGLVVFPLYSSVAGNSYVTSATASNSALNTTGAWSLATLNASAGAVVDIAYSPSSNNWVIASTNGLWSFPNTGAAGTPVAPTGSITATQRYSTVGMLDVWWTGTQFMAHGQSGHIVTSPDGVTWTETGGHILPVGVAGTDWRSSLYDGSRYVLFSDSTNGVIATTPDGVTNYQTQYVQEGAEIAPATNYAFYAPGVMGSTTAPVSGGTWTAVTGMFCVGVNAVSGATRTVGLSYTTTSYEATLPALSAPGSHYFEIVATSVGGTANAFTTNLYVDGTLALTSAAARAFTTTTDTTSVIILTLGRGARFTAVDDMYFTLQDGTGLVGPLGPVSIVVEAPVTDVQAQWVKTGTAVSNSLSSGTTSLSSNSGNYVSSANAGDKDIYGTTAVSVTGYTVKAVQVEGYLSNTGTGTVVANVGLVSGGTESDGTNQSLTTATPTYASNIYSTNPNGNVPWTLAAASAANVALNHIS